MKRERDDSTTFSPKITRFSVRQFLLAEFPEADQELDRYSGRGVPDLIFCEPRPGGKITVIVPLESAANWQREAAANQPANRNLPAETRFVVAPKDSLTIDDMKDALAGTTDRDGFVIDVAALAPWLRKLVRDLGRPFAIDAAAFAGLARSEPSAAN